MSVKYDSNFFRGLHDAKKVYLDDMMRRYERHMLFYQLLERACDLDFKVARKEHCDVH